MYTKAPKEIDEISYMLSHDDDCQCIILSIISPQGMTSAEYLNVLQVFINEARDAKKDVLADDHLYTEECH